MILTCPAADDEDWTIISKFVCLFLFSTCFAPWDEATAWDCEIESLTSVDASLIEPDRRKTRRRHRVTAALASSRTCLLPCKGQPAREVCTAEAWFTIAFFFQMVQLSSSSARRDHSCDR